MAALARIELTEAEIEKFTKELSAILSYVGSVKTLAEGAGEVGVQLGARYNVLRKDVVTNESDQYTKDLLAEMPKTDGRYMVVKKILDIEP